MTTRSRSTGSSRSRSSSRPQPPASAPDESLAAAQPIEARSEDSPAGSQPLTTAEITSRQLVRRELEAKSREARIAEAAYWRAERRGFAAGHELDDWLEAEKEVDSAIAREREKQEGSRGSV